MSNKVVVLDFGHGGRDPGSIGIKTQEKNNNLNLGLKVGKILQQHGVTVNYTRTTDKDFCNGSFDVNEDLANRIAIAKQYNPDVFISFHNNAFNKSAKGNECHCFKFGGNDEKLSRSIQKNIVKYLSMMIDRKVKASNFYVLRLFDKTNTDACLVEYGFIDSEENVILENMGKASIAISNGILEHFGITYVESNSASTIQSPINNNQGDDNVLEKAVLLYSKDDYFAGGDIALKYNCAIFIRPSDKSCPKEAFYAKQLFVIGGSSVKHPNEILLSGNNKFDTCAAVNKFLG